jgi:CBS domain-containing protein
MKLHEVMTPNVEVIHPNASVQEAAELMRSLDVGSLPVCDGRKIQGMITDRDIAIRAVADGREARQTPVREIMTPELVYCTEDEDVTAAAQLMHDHQIRRLPIINEQKELVGIVSLGDLAVETRDEKMAGQVLEGVSEPAKPQRR